LVPGKKPPATAPLTESLVEVRAAKVTEAEQDLMCLRGNLERIQLMGASAKVLRSAR
jgi:hypothetical protein